MDRLWLPRGNPTAAGIRGEMSLRVDATAGVAMALRQTGVYPIEIKSDERIAAFREEDRKAVTGANEG